MCPMHDVVASSRRRLVSCSLGQSRPKSARRSFSLCSFWNERKLARRASRVAHSIILLVGGSTHWAIIETRQLVRTCRRAWPPFDLWAPQNHEEFRSERLTTISGRDEAARPTTSRRRFNAPTNNNINNNLFNSSGFLALAAPNDTGARTNTNTWLPIVAMIVLATF